MAISSPGIGSGLDINGIVSQLMALERRSLTAIDTKEAKYQAQLTAYGTLKGALSTFQSAVASLATTSKFSTLKAGVAESSVAAVSASTATRRVRTLRLAPHKAASPASATRSMAPMPA